MLESMPKERPYHHGNLREALIEAALKLIAETGAKGFTLRELARRAGVSHNAPYRHFESKDELLSAVAAQGFEELDESMKSAARRESTSLEQWRATGIAYIDFALRRPEHFTVMFDEDVQERTGAGERAFLTLVSFVEACERSGDIPAGDPIPTAMAAWAIVHGIAKLAVAHRLGDLSKPQIRAFARSTLDAWLRGLAPAAHERGSPAKTR